MKLFTYLQKALLGLSFLGFCAVVNAQPVWQAEAEDYDGKSGTSRIIFQGVEGGNPEDQCYLSGCGFVENISPSSYFYFNDVTVAEEGTYELHIYYTMKDGEGRGVGVFPNVQEMRSIVVTEYSGDWNGAPILDNDTQEEILPGGTKVGKILIYLEKGTNQLNIGGAGSTWAPNFDKFELYETSENIEKPANVACSWAWDYTDDAKKVSVNGVESDNLKNLVDNNDATIFELKGTQSVNVDFEYDYDMVITGFLIYSGDPRTPIDIDLVEVQASETGEEGSWINGSKTLAGNTKGRGQLYHTNLLAQGYKFIRLKYQTEESDVKIAEFQLFGHPYVYPNDLIDVTVSGTSITGNNGTFTYSNAGINNSEHVAKVLDGIGSRPSSSKYTVASKSFTLTYEFYEETEVKSYSLAVCHYSNDGNGVQRNPKSWTLSGAGWDGVYTVISEEKGFVYPWCSYVNMKFNVQNPGEYVYYKLDVTENNGAGNSHLSEYQLLSDPLPFITVAIEDEKGNSISESGLKAYAKKGSIVLNSVDNASYRVYTLTGLLVKSGIKDAQVDAEVQIQSGIYIVEITSGGNVYRTKVMVQ